MPVIQGYSLDNYDRHVRAYVARLEHGAGVDILSVCKRNRQPQEVAEVLRTVKRVRRNLRLHGFGLKLTSLQSAEVRALSIPLIRWPGRTRPGCAVAIRMIGERRRLGLPVSTTARPFPSKGGCCEHRKSRGAGGCDRRTA